MVPVIVELNVWKEHGSPPWNLLILVFWLVKLMDLLVPSDLYRFKLPAPQCSNGWSGIR